jgi:ABC-type transport system involved in cytochrome c biogenesis permease subunit
MQVHLNEGLSQLSLLGIHAAMALYASAFVVLAIHLSRSVSEVASVRKSAGRLELVGIWLTVVAALAHGLGVVGRAIAAQRVPWANMYEFAITGTFVVVVIFLISQAFRKDIRFIATFVTGFVVLALGVAILATAFFNIAAALSITYLFKTAKWQVEPKGAIAKQVWFRALQRILKAFPAEDKLERTSYRFNIIGFILWSFTLIAGAIWAERAWHRYWGWDTKEVWTFIIWTIYAGYLHANATRGWTGKRSAWLVVVGFAAIVFNFTIVNLYFKGLHVYSGL